MRKQYQESTDKNPMDGTYNDATTIHSKLSFSKETLSLSQVTAQMGGQMSAAEWFLESVAHRCVNCDVYGWNQVGDFY